MSEAEHPPDIEGYRVLGPLGRGAMGTVWRAVDRSGRDVAVKVAVALRHLSAPRRDEMFRREALVALNLRHGNLVRGLEVGETVDGRPFLSMEFVAGETLERRVRSRGPVPEREILPIGHALASALEHAHALGLLHRDVKPDNVMLLPDGGVRLVDLGLAVEHGRDEPGCGSPAYVSPEVIRKQDVGPASDLYSLGVTLASAVLGRPFFRGADVQAVLRANLEVPLVLPERVGDESLSEGLRAVVARLGRKDVRERYGSAGEVRLDFDALMHGERPLGAYLGLARLGRATRSAAWLGAAAAVAAAVAVSFAVLTGRERGESSPPPLTVPSPAAPVAATSAPDDPRAEVALLYVDAHPGDFERGRALVKAALAGSPTPTQRARVEAAALRLEARARLAADAVLAERETTAQALADRGDLDGAEASLSQWPAELRGAPQAEEAVRFAAALRTRTLAPGAKLLAEGAASLAAWRAGGPDGLSPARNLVARIDVFLAVAPRAPTQAQSLRDLRAEVVTEIARLERVAHEQESRDGSARYFDRVFAADVVGARAALEALADESEHPAGVRRWAWEVASSGREVEAALTKRLFVVAGVPWAAILDGRLVVGRDPAPAAPRRVFVPCPPDLSGASVDGVDFGDLLAAEPDPDRAASWLVLVGEPDAAAALSTPRGAVARLLAAARHTAKTVVARRGEAWAVLARRMPLLSRAPSGQAPDVSNVDDPVLRAWLEAARAGSRSSPSATRASAAPSAGLVRARERFLADDAVGAWTALEEAAIAAPGDAEVAFLRCRVLDALARPYPTLGVSLAALGEARRAWDLDRGFPGAARLLAEQCLRFRRLHPGALVQALASITVAACEEAIRLQQADVSMLAMVGAQRLSEGRARDAAPLLRRAARDAPDDADIALSLAKTEDALGDSRRALEALTRARSLLGEAFPEWARTMYDRLSHR